MDVAGVYSGWHIRELNYFADVIHDIASLKDFEFRLYQIVYNQDAVPVDSFWKSLWYRIQFWKKPSVKTVREMEAQEDTSPVSVRSQGQSPQRAPTIKDSKTQKEYVKIPLKVFCTINFVTLLSVVLTITLFVGAALVHDGIACVAFACISVSTSLACWSAQWQPIMAQRPTSTEVPRGHVVIRTRGAALIVVQCDEAIARELYTGTERCVYNVPEHLYKVMVVISTSLLMIAVVLLGNCEWIMQAAAGATYILLNAAYWAIPLFSEIRHNWDTSRYTVECLRTCEVTSYTETLWLAIQATKENAWVENGEMAPRTPEWETWLELAKEHCRNEKWAAVEAKTQLMAKSAERINKSLAHTARIASAVSDAGNQGAAVDSITQQTSSGQAERTT